MAKPPGAGKCVHCLEDPVERNWDHVFPVSWYPDTTPPNLDKWKIPSCIDCNDALGVMEDDLFVILGHVLDPCHPGSAGLYERASRAIDPEAGKDERDRRARAARRKRFLEQVWVGDAIPDHGIYPGLGDRWDQPHNDRMAIPFPKKGLEQITEKIVRGISYIEDGLFIEPPYKTDVFVLNEEGSAPIRQVLERFGTEYARGPGIIVRRAVPQSRPHAILSIQAEPR